MMRNHTPIERARFCRRIPAVALVFCATALVMLGGCEEKKLVVIRNEEEFQRLVLDSPQPVLVEFSKDVCPTCVPVENTLVDVSKEYDGRARFYKFMLLDRFFRHYSPDISNAFGLQYVPTVVLFVDGQERQRWASDVFHDTYRKALTDLVGPPDKVAVASPWQ